MQYKVWKGDITTLRCDAIVNASNESGLGCRIPGHCIDSAIHAGAGPNLLEACAKLGGIPTGEAKITPAFNLPCKWIIHTTGPRKLDSGVLDWRLFRQCYVRCLELARTNKVTSLAFCCLSTGIFAFPRKESAWEAISTVQNWLKEHTDHNIKLIIFNVFTYEDLGLYCERLH